MSLDWRGPSEERLNQVLRTWAVPIAELAVRLAAIALGADLLLRVPIPLEGTSLTLVHVLISFGAVALIGISIFETLSTTTTTREAAPAPATPPRNLSRLLPFSTKTVCRSGRPPMPIQHTQMFRRGLPILAASLSLVPLLAHPAPAEPLSPLFHQVVPQPTGKNGYELLVLAADAYRASPLYEKAQEPGTTLDFKRRVLADRQVVRALKLLHDGLELPVASPRESISLDTALPELAAFRGLARLLSLQQYVFLADGRIADALANARLGLRYSQAVQTDTLISGLVGLAIGSICIDPLARHLDQLSAGDCVTLYQICQEWLALPDPQLRVIARDRTATRNSVEDVKREIKQHGATAAAQQLGQIEGWEGLQVALKGLEAQPAALDDLFAGVQNRMEDQFARVLKEMERPLWERKPVSMDESDLAGKLAGAMTPAYDKVDAGYTRAAARIRLLACHCAVHRYRWEYDHLPASLGVLGLGNLAVDPFTGQPLQYVVRGARYSLSSAGSPAAADDPQAVNGRLPVSITPAD